MAKNKAVFGIYKTKAGVESAVDALKAAGFSSTDISVLMSENVSTREFAHEKHTKAPEGAATGAGSGIVIGGALGWLASIGALAIPGVGPFIAAGPLMAALAGAGIGGTIGGIAGALVGMGIPEYEAKRYEGLVNKGGILLSVHSDSSEEVERAKDILERTGAEDISSSGEAKAEEKVPPGSAEEVTSTRMVTKKAVFGVYKTKAGVESAVDALKAAGFSSTDISVLMSESVSTREFAYEKHTKVPEGTATGAGSGAVIGGSLVGMGIPEYEAKRYEELVNRGGILLSVHSDSSEEVKRAKGIMERTGAEDIKTFLQ